MTRVAPPALSTSSTDLSSLGRSSLRMYVLFSTACLSRKMLHSTLTPSGAGLRSSHAACMHACAGSPRHELLQIAKVERRLQCMTWVTEERARTSFGFCAAVCTGSGAAAGPGPTSNRFSACGSYTVEMPAAASPLQHVLQAHQSP